MGGACNELGELKIEIEKLKKECHSGKELSESLTKDNKELLCYYKEVKILIEQKSLELDAKNEELCEVRQICENLKSSLEEKESSFKHLNFVNEKLRDEFSEQIKLLEEQNRELVVALDESTLKVEDSDRKVCAGAEEIRGLKRLLSIVEKKCLEEDEKSMGLKELKSRDDIINEVEEENRNVKERLKWKIEQFEHLEEAHKLLQNQFHQSKVEWEREKSVLLKDLYSLKCNLDTQIEISEDFQIQLKICNQALSHEESKRKILEIEVVELRSHFGTVVLEFEAAKSKIEKSALMRDENIAELRSELGNKEALNKEMKHRIAHLEVENKELQGLLKELREEQINLAGGVLVRKLETKLKRLEHLHSQCSVNLKNKEVEWNSRYEKMLEVVHGNISDLKDKGIEIQELQKRFEYCYYFMEFQLENEKAMLCDKAEMGWDNKEIERFRDKRSASPKDDNDLHNTVPDAIKICQIGLKEHFEKMELSLQRGSEDILCALELANDEMVKTNSEFDKIKLKLQILRSNAEVAKILLKESQEAHDILQKEKDNFVGLVKDQDDKIGNLGKQIFLFDARIAAKMEDIKSLQLERDHYYQAVEIKDSDIRELRNEISRLKYVGEERDRESAIQARLDAEKTSKEEEERLLKVIKEKDQTCEDLRTLVMLSEQNFENDLSCLLSVITENQIKLDMLIEAMEKGEKLKKLESRKKNKVIGELENRQYELKAEIKAQISEIEKVKNQLSSKNTQILEFQKEKENILLGVRHMNTQREDMVEQMEAAYDLISDLSCKDAQLTNSLENILQNTENNNSQATYLTCNEFTETSLPPSTKNERKRSNRRSPLKALNFERSDLKGSAE